MKYRVLFIEPHEDLDEIIAPIKKIRDESIAIVVPRGSVLLSSAIPLKILRNAVEENGKDFAIVSRDPRAREFCEQFKIPWAADLESFENSLRQKMIVPIPAKKEKPFFRRRAAASATEKKDFERRKRDLLNLLKKPKKGILFLIAGVSVALLFFVATLALPGATIFLTPQKKIIEVTTNVTIDKNPAENSTDLWRKNIIAAAPFETIVEKTIRFPTQTFLFTGKNATGEILIKNKTADEITLRPKTQFLAKNGATFRIENWAKIPAGGETRAKVLADERDKSGIFIGARGNLDPGEKLIVPKLPENLRANIFAEVLRLSGGVDGKKPKISEKDFEIAKKQISKSLFADAKKNIRLFLNRRNRLEKKDFVLVPDDRFLKTEILDLDLPENLLGADAENFLVRARMRVSAVAYSRADLRAILKKEFEKSLSPKMELLTFDDGDLLPEVVDISPRGDRIKISVSARGIQTFVIEPKTAAGVAFVDRVKKTIAGKSVATAKKLLENFPEISAVRIELWPPFSRKIPILPENISVKLSERENL